MSHDPLCQSLDGNNLVGTIASEFGHVNSLQTLTLTKGQLSNTTPKAIGNLNLRVLHLCENKLSGPVPIEIYDLI